MSYLADYVQLLRHLDRAVQLPVVTEVLLPAVQSSPEKKDEFGFVLLADGSVGPFYASLQHTLAELQRMSAAIGGADTLALARRLGDRQLHRSALALGAFNALSQHLMHKAGFDPAQNSDPSEPIGTGCRLGMVGYFPPLVRRYLRQGCRMTIIEMQPERVPADPRLEVHTSPQALAGCSYVICTASTLINNTIDLILDAVGSPAVVNLFGPSASGLPDPLFARGAASVGGIIIDEPEKLRDALAAGESWGHCGRKYRLTLGSYPGLARLLSDSSV